MRRRSSQGLSRKTGEDSRSLGQTEGAGSLNELDPHVKPTRTYRSRRNAHEKDPHLRLGRVTHRICVHGESGSMRALVLFAVYLERDTSNFFYQYILTLCSPW